MSAGHLEASRPYWNMEVEPFLDSPQMRELQLYRLQRHLTLLYDGAPFWRRRMDRFGAKPSDIRRLGDLAKALPPCRKQDLREDAEKYGAVESMHQMIAAPLDQLRLLAATSGTTGEPTPYPYTPAGLEINNETYARIFWRAGIRPGDRILHGFGLSMFVGGVPIVMAASAMGACPIPVGAEAGAERLLKVALSFKPRALFCTPSYAEHLIEAAPKLIGKSVASLGVQIIVAGGEPGAGLPEVRRKIESAYGARLFDIGGAGGGSCDWHEYQGMHNVRVDASIIELVDPETDEIIPLEDGARGEACVSTIVGDGSLGGIRNSLGDIMEVTMSPCPCGRSGFRYRIVGRTDDMLKVKGAIVYPAALDDVIAAFYPRVTGEFRIVLDEPPPRVTPPLKLKIERGEGVEGEALQRLESEILEAMHGKLRVTPAITWLAPDTLERTGKKTQFFERTYL
ncbi:MAG TPA: AMP-binding protein [Steroidobacter sp.]|jgi:phenylacetate-CoA ligase|nr:AMP-binding protein [Steroidobacteraceae bacterium]HLS83027.1 AMP-binding protein [Steroidobacter sp.]